MAAGTYNTEPIPALRASEPAMAYGSNAMMLHLQEEIMRQPLEMMENLQVFLQNAIAAVKAKAMPKTWEEKLEECCGAWADDSRSTDEIVNAIRSEFGGSIIREIKL